MGGFDGKTNPNAGGTSGKPRDLTQPQSEGRGPGTLPAFQSRTQEKAGEPYDRDNNSIPPGGIDVLTEADPRGDVSDVQSATRPFRVS